MPPAAPREHTKIAREIFISPPLDFFFGRLPTWELVSKIATLRKNRPISLLHRH